MASSGSNLSREFFDLLKAIGESKSKQEEDRVIQREVMMLKRKLETPTYPPGGKKKTGPSLPGRDNSLNNKRHAKEFLVRLLYVEMLGHDGSFGYIKALELAASSLITHKRVGYLVSASCLPPQHEFRFMLVNQMQRDLNSSHILEASASLLAVTKIITSDMVPAISADVVKLLGHSNETIRKKAIIALHRFHQIAPDCVTESDLIEKIRRSLCDKDPSVMGASLNVIYVMAQRDPIPFKDLIPSLISILKQICDHRLPSDFDYHRVPAPWLQLMIIRILAILGKADANASSGIYEILGDCMKKADVGINIGYAITYECIRTITTIYPNPSLLDAAAEAISGFITSRSQNLRYLGVTGLASIVEQHPQYAAAHQLAVIECLEDTDETLQRKTLDLLYRMTNPVNVEFITEKLLQFLKGTTDPFLKKSLTEKICRIAERFAPSNTWYVRVITELMQTSGDLVKEEVAQNLMALVAEGPAGDEESDMQLRIATVELYASLLKKPKLPKVLAETMAWMLGEYAYLSQEQSLNSILDQLCTLTRKSSTVASSSTRKFFATAIMKLVAQLGTCPPTAAQVIDDFTKSRDFDLQQRTLEFQNLLTSASHVMGEVLPVDASCEDVEADEDLNFLSGYVQEALNNGAKPYSPPTDEDDEDDDNYDSYGSGSKKSSFNFTAYEKPQQPVSLGYLGSASSANRGGTQQYATGPNLPPGAANTQPIGGSSEPVAQPSMNTGEPQLVLRNVANVWGKGGMSSGQAPTPPAAPPVPVATPTPTPAPSYSSYNPNPYMSQQAPQQPEKPREMTEKERMAAALFGGIVPGAPPVAPPAPAPAPAPPVPATPVPKAAPEPAPVPAPAPAIKPEPVAAAPVAFDLLDFSDPASAPSSTPAPAPSIAMMMDPFGGSSPSSTHFEYNNQKLSPLTYSTPDFGGAWGSLPFTKSKSSMITTPSFTLDSFMNKLSSVGLHPVEAIPSTSEGIAAGKVGDVVVLLHGKVDIAGKKVDITAKSSDENLVRNLSEFLNEW